MRPLYSFLPYKYLLFPLPQLRSVTFLPSTCLRASYSIIRNAHSDGESDAGAVFAMYDPITGDLVTQRASPAGNETRDLSPKPEAASAAAAAWARVVPQTTRMRKADRAKVSWVCGDCGANFSQWWGTCRECDAVGSVREFVENSSSNISIGGRTVVAPTGRKERSWLSQQIEDDAPKSLAAVNKDRDQAMWRIQLSGLFGLEFSRVLGGGIVPGSLVLIGGEPGVGKSSLMLQIAANVAEGFNRKEASPVVYVSGEESIEQIGNRADRMRISTGNLYLYCGTDVEDILEKIRPLAPAALVVDSIQTVYLRGVVGSAGNLMQVKECTAALLRFAKQTNIPIFLTGNVTKTGDIAGPRALEHIVDVVLYMEGERYSSYRLLRAVKNRFGSTDELGVFEMVESGLRAVTNTSEMFLSEHGSDSEVLAGLAASVVVDCSRAFVIEVQALCVSGSLSSDKLKDSRADKHITGLKVGRVDLIIAVLIKQAGLKLHDCSIFLNVVSGFKLNETAGDLAVAAAICSSFLEFPIPNNIAFIGEIGLGGEIRTVPRMEKRVTTLAKLGYKRCIVPKAAEKALTALDLDITLTGCKNLKEVINAVFIDEDIKSARRPSDEHCRRRPSPPQTSGTHR